MAKRMLVLTIGYDYYAAEPHDAAVLIETFGRLIKVEAGSDWKDPHVPSADQKHPLTAVQFLDVADAPIAKASTTDEPIEPAPVADPEFRMTNATASWEDWLKQVRYLEGDAAPWLEDTLRHYFDRGDTPNEALEIPF